jgi:hypothetical protein
MALFKKLGKAVKKAVVGGAVAAASKNMTLTRPMPPRPDRPKPTRPPVSPPMPPRPPVSPPVMPRPPVAAATKQMTPALGGAATAAAKPAVGAPLQKKSIGKVLRRGLIGRR